MTQPIQSPSPQKSDTSSKIDDKASSIQVTQQQRILIEWLAKMQIYT